MQQNPIKFVERTQKYSSQEDCLEGLSRHRWENGFICTKCGCQFWPIAGTVFELTRLLLLQCVTAIYLMGTDKGGISSERLSKMVVVYWPKACRMLRKLRQPIGARLLARGACRGG